jgi:hypothetical protein
VPAAEDFAMRGSISLALVGAAGAWACAQTPPAPLAARPPAAVSAQRYATPANETTHLAPHGYSAEARRVADCLASYPGYDLRTDQIEVSPGVNRRCPL